MNDISFVFSGTEICDLAALTAAAETYRPTASQIFHEAFWRDDLPAETLDLLRKEADIDGYSFSASDETVDPNKIPPGLIFTPGHGGVISSNAHDVSKKIAALRKDRFDEMASLPDEPAYTVDSLAGHSEAFIPVADIKALCTPDAGRFIKIVRHNSAISVLRSD